MNYDELKMLAQDRSSVDGNLPYGQNTTAAAAAAAAADSQYTATQGQSVCHVQ